MGEQELAVRVVGAGDRVGPAEVVQRRHAVGVAAARDVGAHRLVHRAHRHVVGVVRGIPGTDAVRDGDGAQRVGARAQHGAVARAVHLPADERLAHGQRLHLVVVLAYKCFLGGDVGVRQQARQHLLRGRRGALRVHRRRRRRLPDGAQLHLRQPVVQELQVQQPYQLAGVAQLDGAVRGERAQIGDLHLAARSQLRQCVVVLRRHRQAHPLLRLGHQDLPRFQPLVLERRARQLQPHPAARRRHLPERRRQAAGAIVGNGAVQAQVARLQQKVGHLLLRDGIADLHRRPGRGLVQRQRREGGAVNAVAPDAPAHHHRAVAGARLGLPRGGTVQVRGQDAAGAAEHQRFAHETLVEQHRTGHRRDAGLVAAVDDAAMHALQHRTRRQQAARHVAQARRCEAQHVGVENGTRTAPGADDVAVDADDTGDGAAVRIERGRRVVGLRLEAQQRFGVELDDPGIVVEHRTQEAVAWIDLAGGGADTAVEQGADGLDPAVLAVFDGGVEDLVLAVLGPGLGEHLQLDIGGGVTEPGLAP